ncbi:ABC transporter substrate-binding protein [Microbacterium karelineae]|uniref:ABC transporter substrate-binding protein n=1 Tax=Microbacterium karelineae TaxID=2654283 RepID=UPI0012EAC205|nr:ABC transporter substrate-binding protein [Microbacterium karelineae]
MHTITKAATATAAVLALSAGLAGCSVDSTIADAEAGTAGGAITIGTLRAQPHLYTPFTYDDFAPEGTEIEVVLFDTSSDIKNAVVSGSIDFGVTGAASVISGVAEEQDVTIVASSADGGTRIVASPDITSVDDLIGAKVGFPMGATQEILLKRTLEAQGLDPLSDVELVNLPFSDMATAYGSGQIDAFISAETGPSIAITEGAYELISAYDTEIGRTNIVLAARPSYIADNPEVVQTIVDAHVAASEHLAAHPDEWSAGLVDEFAIEKDVVDAAIENIWPRWEVDEAFIATLEAMSVEMAAFDQIANEADIEELVDTTFVDQVEVE